MDRNGKILNNKIVRDNLLKIDDAYCPPELFDKKKTMNYKYDSWIFGCLLYEFIWGHKPKSFIVELMEHINSRDSTHGLSDILNMEDLPNDFLYQPINMSKIN